MMINDDKNRMRKKYLKNISRTTQIVFMRGGQ